MLLRHRLPADLLTPLSAYLALRAEGASLLLESADQGEHVGRHSFVLLQGEGELRLDPPGHGWVEALRALAGPVETARGELAPDTELPEGRDTMPIGVGCAGYVGFEALGAQEPTLALPARNSLGLPTVWMRRFDAALVFDHLHQVAELQVRASSGETATARLCALREALKAPVIPLDKTGDPVAEPLLSRGAYEAFVRHAQDLIHDGDVYQLVPSQRIRVRRPPSSLTAYRRMRRLNPSPYGFLLEWEGFALAGASPEMLVRVADGEAETLPIAGTVPRGSDEVEDAARFEALRSDAKELAEHQMLVDLARNDLGRISVPGGVRVEKPLALQRTSHVLHLTTTVKGRLRPGLDALDVLAACFPAGTVSGAPKIRAAQRIAELEGDQRGPYGGALLRLAADGSLDTALILRTVVYSGGDAYLQAGAGVVRASDPSKEYRETLHKMGAPAAALDVDLSALFEHEVIQ
ncbi:MAG TPA: anthranilate synthase component I family protein [Holophagaceae bacterium]|jgi:anthranilate synthase component 1|nr:anthranilate synthase component I family protein [Holophagaceae bacterium]